MPVLGGLQVGRQDWKVDGAFRSTQARGPCVSHGLFSLPGI